MTTTGYGPGHTMDPEGPVRDVKVCMTPADETLADELAERLGDVTRSEVVRRGLRALDLRTRRKKNRASA